MKIVDADSSLPRCTRVVPALMSETLHVIWHVAGEIHDRRPRARIPA